MPICNLCVWNSYPWNTLLDQGKVAIPQYNVWHDTPLSSQTSPHGFTVEDLYTFLPPQSFYLTGLANILRFPWILILCFEFHRPIPLLLRLLGHSLFLFYFILPWEGKGCWRAWATGDFKRLPINYSIKAPSGWEQKSQAHFPLLTFGGCFLDDGNTFTLPLLFFHRNLT